MKHNHFSQVQNQKPAGLPEPTAAAEQNEINFTPSPDEVARRAYFCYQNTGSLPGHEVQHWLKAEADLIAERNKTRVHGFMKTKFTLLAIGGSLLLGAASLCAQIMDSNANTNSPPLKQTLKYQVAVENERSLGERALLPPGLKEKLRLTDDQQAGLKPVEDDFARTSREYQAANQPRIDAATEAIRQARGSKNEAQIQSARHQLQNVWAGLQPFRTAAVKQVKPLLTPDQLAILEDPDNQWREDHVNEANDPSAH